MDKLIGVIAEALDIVEGELLGASTHHGRRIAALCVAMGKKRGMDMAELITLSAGALLHDSALTEYILAERMGGHHDPSMKLHCEYGQRNIETMGLPSDTADIILYHHERTDGSGPYGKKTGEYPLNAELIGIADMVDVTWHLQRRSPEDIPKIASFIEKSNKFRSETAALLMDVLDEAMLSNIDDTHISKTAESSIPPWEMDGGNTRLQDITAFIGRVIDYKSSFTCRHSAGIVEKAAAMAAYYGYDLPVRNRLCLAANLHDIGKLAVPSDILEKPGKLSDEEFKIIAYHVQKTAELLSDLEGLDDVRAWASNHHEKLNGTGYPLGKKAAVLDFNSRLMTCLDIYQAVSEERPYHPVRDHAGSMAILYEMAADGAIDKSIVKDMDKALGATQ
jgi:HD-GYP domain-containing protein (c-di-GMP phosphodiesterase class II)